MPSGRKNPRVALDEIAPRFLKFCFIASVMIFLLTLLAGFFSALEPAELIVFTITIFLSLCVMIGSGIAIRVYARRQKRLEEERKEAERARRGGNMTISEWLDANPAKGAGTENKPG